MAAAVSPGAHAELTAGETTVMAAIGTSRNSTRRNTKPTRSGCHHHCALQRSVAFPTGCHLRLLSLGRQPEEPTTSMRQARSVRADKTSVPADAALVSLREPRRAPKLRHVRDVRFWPFRRRRNRAPRRIHSPRRRRGSSLADRHDVAQEFLAAAQPARRVLRRTDSRRPGRCSRSRHRGRERAGFFHVQPPLMGARLAAERSP